MYNKGSLTLTNSTVSGNSALSSGGGVANQASLTLLTSTVLGNSADLGGGVVNFEGSLTLARTVVSGNSASSGREVRKHYGTITAANFNLFGHDGETDAQAFFNFTPSATDITATSDGTTPTALGDILNTTLADNGGPTQTHALVSGSPAIDASPADADCEARDQRGVIRPQGTACDIGAFEVSLEVHDLAVTNVTAPATVILTAAKPQQIKTVKVQIQNRSPQDETITTLAGLVSLTVESLTPGMCTPTMSLSDKQAPLPKTLKPKQKLSVNFDVTFDCALDPAKSTAKNPGHEDFAYEATVDHAAVDGQPDSHLDDDSCPRGE